MQSLVRALGLLDQLALHDGGLTLTEAAVRAKLPRSTAHRLLTTMESMRYVAFDRATSQWQVGSRALAFGGATYEVWDLGRAARPILESLQLDTGLTATLSVPDSDSVRLLAQARAINDRVSLRQGDRCGFDSGASGMAMLAFWPKARAEVCMERGGGGPSSTDRLKSEAVLDDLAQVRRRGFAVADEALPVQWRSVAVPVLDRNGHAVAAVALSGSFRGLPDAKLSWLGAILRHSADLIAEEDLDRAAAWRPVANRACVRNSLS